MTGVWVLLGAVGVAAAVALVLRARDGRFRSTTQDPAAEGAELLSADDIGAPLGARVTLVQFSSAFCAPCRTTRVLLADVAGRGEGVRHVEIDAESRLELVRRLDILRTPTVLVLDAHGAVVRRASGVPQRHQVEAAIALASRPTS